MTTAVAIHTIDDVERMAKYVVESGLFGMKTIPQASALMLLCQAKGMHPMEAVEEFHIIQGRNTTKTERMMAKFQAAGGKVQWHQLDDAVADATFSHPAGGTVRLQWTVEMAKKAGLAGKDNWKNYPRAMLRSRVVSEGIKTVYPGAGGLTPEEAADLPPAFEPERDVTPAPPTKGVAALAARVAELAPAEEPAPTVDTETGELLDVTFAEVDRLMAAAETDEAKQDCIDLARHLPEEQRVMLRKRHGAKFKKSAEAA